MFGKLSWCAACAGVACTVSVLMLSSPPSVPPYAGQPEYPGAHADTDGSPAAVDSGIDSPLWNTGSGAAVVPVWRTLALGSYENVNRLREALDSFDCGRGDLMLARHQGAVPIASAKQLRCALGESASEIIGRPAFTLGRKPGILNLAVVSASELGVESEVARVGELYARARQRGLDPAPAEAGPLLRLQYLDQPPGEFLRIAMMPIARYGGELIALTVANDGASLLLIGGDGSPGLLVHASTRFVFAAPTRVAAGL